MIILRFLFLVVFSAIASGCVRAPEVASIGPAHATGCALASFPADTRVASTSIDTVAGVYRWGAATLTVRREDYRLLVDIPGSGVRETRMIGEWRFADGCGAVYQFSIPLSGVGSRLSIVGPDGTISDWRTDSA